VLEGSTLEAAAEAFEVSRERVRQVVGKKVRQLRHPSRGDVPEMYGGPRFSTYGVEQMREHKDFWLPRLDEMAEQYLTPPAPKAKPTVVDLSTPIDSLMLTVRTENCLKAEGVTTVGDLLPYTEVALGKIPNFGANSLKEVKTLLLEYGHDLAEGAPLELSASIMTLKLHWSCNNILAFLNHYGLTTIADVVDKTKEELQNFIEEKIKHVDKSDLTMYVRNITEALQVEGFSLRDAPIIGMHNRKTAFTWHDNVSKLGLSSYIVNILKKNGITVVGQLLRLTHRRLSSLPDVTKLVRDKIVFALMDHKLKLWKEPK
jgi:DNA-directed RNA polymerase alpha subunit